MSSGEENLLSTDDNPYNPWTEWDQWYAWDARENYHSLSLLASTLQTSDELPVQAQEMDGEAAITIIVTENLSGHHIKVPNPLLSTGSDKG